MARNLKQRSETLFGETPPLDLFVLTSEIEIQTKNLTEKEEKINMAMQGTFKKNFNGLLLKFPLKSLNFSLGKSCIFSKNTSKKLSLQCLQKFPSRNDDPVSKNLKFFVLPNEFPLKIQRCFELLS